MDAVGDDVHLHVAAGALRHRLYDAQRRSAAADKEEVLRGGGVPMEGDAQSADWTETGNC